ncbi:P-loop containing nucleoside triphosphate hydrolase [Phytophthora cactorum]|nr:P-loop containing nucleoside triphosphate hydrolase [Phytophthora cactorum]
MRFRRHLTHILHNDSYGVTELDDAPPALEDAEAPALSMIPVTILSGFLGAGRRLHLSASHGKRIAVIENEFGEEIGVESLVAKDGAGGDVMDGFYELSNGCVCCSVRDDLVNTLEKLLERRDRFDYIVVETTGMADPGKVASVFWVDDELEGRIFLDGIVTLVDAPRLNFHLTHPDTQREAAAQLAYADRILLNKGDLVPDIEQRLEIEQKVTQVNGVASVRWTERSRVDLDDILNIKSFTTSRAEQVEKELHTLLTEGKEEDHENCKDESHDHVTTQEACRPHTDRWTRTSSRGGSGAPVGPGRRWAAEIKPGSEAATRQKLFRVKGVVAIAGEPTSSFCRLYTSCSRCMRQKNAGLRNELNNKASRVTQVVFIGLHLRKSELEAGLRSCVVADN